MDGLQSDPAYNGTAYEYGRWSDGQAAPPPG